MRAYEHTPVCDLGEKDFCDSRHSAGIGHSRGVYPLDDVLRLSWCESNVNRIDNCVGHFGSFSSDLTPLTT
jgi:hypothetical protein